MEPTASPAANNTASASAAASSRDDDTLTIRTYADESSGMPIVAATGDVDLCTTPTLRDALEAVFTEASAASSGVVALDMREVGFIDSAGLALLVEIRKRFYEKSKLALLVQKGSQPERVLRLGRFDTFLKVGYQPEDVSGSGGTASVSPVSATV